MSLLLLFGSSGGGGSGLPLSRMRLRGTTFVPAGPPVTTTAELITALNAAHSGDTIVCAGTFGTFTLNGYHAPGVGVTIASNNPAVPAVFSLCVLTNCSGITFSRLEFVFPTAATDGGSASQYGMNLTNCTDITVNRCYLSGYNIANEYAGTPPGVNRTSFRSSGGTNISVTNTEFYLGRRAMSLGANTDFTISGSLFHDVREDCIQFGQCVNLLIDDNLFRASHPWEGTPPGFADHDHGDFMQGTSTSSQPIVMNGVTVTNNLICQDGPQADVCQGVFITISTGPRLANIDVEDNVIYGGNANTIDISGVDGVIIKNNTVWAQSGSTIVQIPPRALNFTNYTNSGNVMAGTAAGGQEAAAIAAWLVAHPNVGI